MTLPGGAANKLGNLYEKWWTLIQFTRMLEDPAVKDIQLEAPGAEKAEFIITTAAGKEHHQAKRRHHAGKWSLATLVADGILAAIGHILTEDKKAQYVFVSGSDAPELRKLCEASLNTDSFEDFKNGFLSAGSRSQAFQRILEEWDFDEQRTYAYLRRIKIRVSDDESLRNELHSKVQALFSPNVEPQKIISQLDEIKEEYLHRKVTRETLKSTLNNGGYQLRRLFGPNQAYDAVQEVTSRYLRDTKRGLILGEFISRDKLSALLARPIEEKIDNVVITGDAGSGKTAFVSDAVRAMCEKGLPVLAFRVDQVPGAVNAASLGENLGFEGSPSQVLAAAAETVEQPGVLVVDQLDAISAMSGRNAAVFNAVDELLREVRGLHARIAIRVIVVCREFDWRHDAQLRQLVPETESEHRIEVAKFPVDKVKEILSELDSNLASLPDRQLKLFQLPQNLRLFTETRLEKSDVLAFGTATDLFDKYWEVKRGAVRKARPQATDQWMAVMKTICEHMASSQQLSVPRETLDDFPPDYVEGLVSENVLIFSGNRYGFGHESFFDYCSARMFFRNSDSSLVSLLKETEQHLFQRARVRQVLAYLRDKDHHRYLQELRSLISDSDIRPHIKDLILALFFKTSDPTEEEWRLFLEWFDPMIEIIASGESPQDEMMEVIRRRFFQASEGWFEKLCQKSKVKQWLASENSRVVDMAVTYLRTYQRDFPTQVAQLLRPYTDCGGEWLPRFRYLVEWTDSSASREFFDLVLRLVENGTLDNARAPIATNGTFWLMFSDLRENHLDLVPELLSCWLKRRFSILRDAGMEEWDIFERDNFAAQLIKSSAEHYPDVFAKHILPVMLDISDAAATGTKPPKHVGIWPFLVKPNENPDGRDACLFGLSQSLATLAERGSGILSDAVPDLQKRVTSVSNYLLLALYAGGKKRYADEAITLLCDEPWRFECGTSSSGNWYSAQAIQATVSSCSEEHLIKLEETLLSYSPPFERTARGRSGFGKAQFNLLSAIPEPLRSNRVKKRLGELRRKFGEPQARPREIQAQWVSSPISEEKATHMTDDQWLQAMEQHAGGPRWDKDNIVGGAAELGGVLESQAKQDPVRFARLSLKFSTDAHREFLIPILTALADAEMETEQKIQVCAKAFIECFESSNSQRSERLGKAIADVLGKIIEPLPDSAVDMLGQLATKHPDPSREVCRAGAEEIQYFGEDIYTHGINSVRGRSAMAIHNLILSDQSYITRFLSILDQMAKDSHPAALSCIARAFHAVAKHDEDLSLKLFQQIDLSDGRLFATPHVERFIRSRLGNFSVIQLAVESALRSSDPAANESGARLASLANLQSQNASDLVEEALHGNARHRLGVAQVAAANFGKSEFREWSERILCKLFDDHNEEVLREIASCFQHGTGGDSIPSEDFIRAFCDSEAFRQDSWPLLNALEDAHEQLPKATCLVCEKFLDRLSEEARDIQTGHSMQVSILTKLIFRAYHQHQNDEEWAPRLLTLIDRLCLERISTDAEKEFALFDR